jgi:signal transduction histidine kinase/ActR/RegA family two-component response regulator
MNILNIEDSETDYQLILHHLKKGGVQNISSLRVESKEELAAALREKKWDIVISDYNIPGFSPMEALSAVRETSKYLPFIVVSGLVGEESVADMMKAGVEDFVIKSRLERLAPVVKRAMREVEVHEQAARSRYLAKRAFDEREEMLAIVYHDIKNPLAAIQLDAQMIELLTHKEPSEEMMSDLRVQTARILRTVNRLKALVSDLLEQNNSHQKTMLNSSFVIRKASHNPLQVLNEVLDSYRPLIQEKKILIKKTVMQRNAESQFDKDRIYQVISNLLGNSIKFTPVNGEIQIHLEENFNGEVLFTISDNGPGISSEHLPKVFDKHWTNGTGNGLGLYICKSIITAHGGAIIAAENPTGGAKFSFNIPAGPSDKHEIPSYAKKPSDIYQKNDDTRTIYVIDDDEDLREAISWALEKENFRVLSYRDTETALEDLSLSFYTPHLIVLDYHLGKSNGNDFLIKKSQSEINLFKSCPVVMISAAPQEIHQKVDANLFQDVLSKPLDLNKLINTVKANVLH